MRSSHIVLSMALLTAVLTGWFISSPETLSYLHLESWGLSKPEIPIVSTQTSPTGNASSEAMPLGLQAFPTVHQETANLLGETFRIFDTNDPEFPSVSPDGTRLAYMGNHLSEIFLVNILTGEEKLLVKTNFKERGFLSDMRWQGNTQLAVYENACGGMGEVYLINTETGTMKFVDDLISPEEKKSLADEFGEEGVEVDGYYHLHRHKKLTTEFSNVPIASKAFHLLSEENRVDKNTMLLQSDGIWIIRSDGSEHKILDDIQSKDLFLKGVYNTGNTILFYLVDTKSGYIMVYQSGKIILVASVPDDNMYSRLVGGLTTKEGIWLIVTSHESGLIFFPANGGAAYRNQTPFPGESASFSPLRHSIVFMDDQKRVVERKLVAPQ